MFLSPTSSLIPWEVFWAAHFPLSDTLGHILPLFLASTPWPLPPSIQSSNWVMSVERGLYPLVDLCFHRKLMQGSWGSLGSLMCALWYLDKKHVNGYFTPGLAMPQYVSWGQASLAHLIQVSSVYQLRVFLRDHLVLCGLWWWPIGKRDWLPRSD